MAQALAFLCFRERALCGGWQGFWIRGYLDDLIAARGHLAQPLGAIDRDREIADEIDDRKEGIEERFGHLAYPLGSFPPQGSQPAEIRFNELRPPPPRPRG